MYELYAFQLGRVRDLCLAELFAVLGSENYLESVKEMAIFRLSPLTQEELEKIQNLLGGTIKIVKLEKSITRKSTEKDLENEISEILEESFREKTDQEETNIENKKSKKNGKIPFAINIFGSKNSIKKLKHIKSKKLLNFVKSTLRTWKFSCRFVNNNSNNPKPSTIYKAKILQKGIDLNLLITKKSILIGKTLTIQNIDDYSLRDFKKPHRDAKNGMLPPKLSQIMINLSELNKLKNVNSDQETITLFDPFCGTGTILMEAILMRNNWQLIGSDLNPKMQDYSEKNCQWTIEKFFRTSNSPETKNNQKLPTIFTKDARFITKIEQLDVIITEGYLGKPFSHFPTAEELEKEFRELSNLHLNWLKNIHQFLKKEGRIVMCLTNYQNPQTKEIYHFPKFDQLAETAGYKIIDKFLYSRKDQIVAREIIILEKQQ